MIKLAARYGANLTNASKTLPKQTSRPFRALLPKTAWRNLDHDEVSVRMISKGADPETRGADPESWTDEAEQRDESSERESHAMRLKPAELKDLYTLDTLRSLAPVASTWTLIFASIAVAVWSHSWAVWIVAAIIVGRSQHALAVLMHDAAHFRILENRALNDFVGQWLCAFPIASN